MERTFKKRKDACRTWFICLILLAPFAASGQHLTIDSIYKSQVGVREKTGRNDGVDVEKYLSVCGLNRGQPWCAAYVSWCHLQAKISAPKAGYSPDLFRSHVVYHRNWKKDFPNVEKGMVFGLFFPNLGRVAHVGFIDNEDSKAFYTVEGNTNQAGSREGDGVYCKKRMKNSIYVISKY